MLKVIIVTPSYNSDKTIARTLNSVLNLKGRFELFYHIQDGGSTDNTLSIIRSYKSRFDSAEVGDKKVNFTYESTSDNGMYDAIQKSFSKFVYLPDSSWMSWINSDDTLHENALLHLLGIDEQLSKDIKWVTGKTATKSLDGVENVLSIRLNNAVISAGLCDGKHWNFVQQEGTFFRVELWKYFSLTNELNSLKYAGDWFLWVKLAEKYKIYQIDHVMAYFHKNEGQISQLYFNEYLDETNDIIDFSKRKQNLEKIIEKDTIQYLIEESNSTYTLIKGTVLAHAKYRLNELKEEIEYLKLDSSVAAYDHEWQFPAITEKYSYQKILDFSFRQEKDFVYVAFPWATLIDYLNCKKNAHAAKLRRVLIDFRMHVKGHSKVVTVCQHIHMLKYQEIFDFVGITDVFWSHAVHDEYYFPNFKNINIHPFPLFPVQAIGTVVPEKQTVRDILYSFIGARSNKWYLTDSRNMIIDFLENDSRGLVIGRDSWHYNKIVYEHQINKKPESDKLIDTDASEQFKSILKRSIFSLCPSGSGPNSIRLWESIGFGSIPVILADTYLPPGNLALWDEAVVYCQETDEAIRGLPQMLENLAKDTDLLDRKRHALKQLWLLYGPDSFIYDIVKLSMSTDLMQEVNTVGPKPFFSNKIKNLVDFKCKESILLLAFISRILIDFEEFKKELQSDEITKATFDNLICQKSSSSNSWLIDVARFKGVLA